MAQVSAETINPAHPGSKFSGGNLETLSDKPGNPVQQALKISTRSTIPPI